MIRRFISGRLVSTLVLGCILLVLPEGIRAQESQTGELTLIMAGLRSTWQEMEGLHADFTHTFVWVLADETQVTKGRLWLAGRNRFRLEFDERTIVSDGRDVWDYDRKKKQVLIYRSDPSGGIANQEQLFLAYTEGVEAQWVREEGEGEDRRVVIRLLRGENEDPQSVDVWVDPVRMIAVRADYMDGAGNNHSYVLEGIELTAQPEEKFKFTIPEGVVVVDMRPGGGE